MRLTPENTIDILVIFLKGCIALKHISLLWTSVKSVAEEWWILAQENNLRVTTSQVISIYPTHVAKVCY